jgi:hypothetical protein
MKMSLPLLVLIAFMAGCSSTGIPGTTHTSYSREVVLSPKHPEDEFIKARLVKVARDGTTTIEVTETGETLTAAPGEYFVSSAYGRVGLQLLSASADRNEVRLLRAWCETK